MYSHLDLLRLLLYGSLVQLDDILQLLIPFQQSLAELRRQLKICAKRKSHFSNEYFSYLGLENIFDTHKRIFFIAIYPKYLHARKKIVILKKLINYVYRKISRTPRTLSVHVRKLVKNIKETPNVNSIEIDLAWLRMTMNRDNESQVVAFRANAPVRAPSF